MPAVETNAPVTRTEPEHHARVMNLTHGSTIVSPAVTTVVHHSNARQDLAANRSQPMRPDLATALKGLGLFGIEEVFWLSADPVITDEELDLRTSCL